jgi:hypothetical protein
MTPTRRPIGALMLHSPFLSGRSGVERAEALQRDFGDDAAIAALTRALDARARDNAAEYCHWREVERLCALPVAVSDQQRVH